MHPQKKFHQVFSIFMGAMMISIMTLEIMMVNVGWSEQFLGLWTKAFVIAYIVGVPVIYLLATVARKRTERVLAAK